MRKTFFSAAKALLMVLLVCAAFVPDAFTGTAGKGAVGTIKVCWGLTCNTDVETTVVQLVNSHGQVVGSCTITPPDDCCKITGDFPTGTYRFIYYRPTGLSQCTTGTFAYTNGTDVTLEVICRCP